MLSDWFQQFRETALAHNFEASFLDASFKTFRKILYKTKKEAKFILDNDSGLWEVWAEVAAAFKTTSMLSHVLSSSFAANLPEISQK